MYRVSLIHLATHFLPIFTPKTTAITMCSATVVNNHFSEPPGLKHLWNDSKNKLSTNMSMTVHKLKNQSTLFCQNLQNQFNKPTTSRGWGGGITFLHNKPPIGEVIDLSA